MGVNSIKEVALILTILFLLIALAFIACFGKIEFPSLCIASAGCVCKRVPIRISLLLHGRP